MARKGSAEAPSPGASIVQDTTLVPLDQLDPYPGNPRQGDVGVLVESLREHGQYRALVVDRRNNQVLAGNHTLRALRELDAAEALVHFVDVDDDQARKIVLVDNRASDRATYDEHALAEQLTLLGDDLAGTGWEKDDVGALFRRLNAPLEFPDAEEGASDTAYQCPHCGYEWSGLPRPNGPGPDPEDD